MSITIDTLFDDEGEKIQLVKATAKEKAAETGGI